MYVIKEGCGIKGKHLEIDLICFNTFQLFYYLEVSGVIMEATHESGSFAGLASEDYYHFLIDW